MSNYTQTTVSGFPGVNSELGKVSTAIASKIDSSGGSLTGTLDANEQRIINLPTASDPSEAMPLGQGLAIQEAAETAAEQAEQFAAEAASDANRAEIAAGYVQPYLPLNGIKELSQTEFVIQTTLGYHTGSGIGRGQYIWNPARSWLDHNGGTVLSSQAMAVYDGTTTTLAAFLSFPSTAGSGCWELILPNCLLQAEFTINNFGALPNNPLIDNYPSIQKAWDVATSLPFGATVGGIGGVYDLSNYVTIRSNTEFFPDNGTTLRGRFASPLNRIVTSPADELQHNIKLKNFTIDRTITNSQHGMLLGGIKGLLVDGVDVYGFGPGVMSGAMGISPFDKFAAIQSEDVLVQNCTITMGNNFGIAFGNVKNGRMTQNTFKDCWREAIGLEAWGDGTPAFNNTLGVLENCTADFNTIYIDTRAGNHFGGFAGPAAFIGASSSEGKCINSSINNNKIYINNTAAIEDYAGIICFGGTIHATEGCTIQDNLVFGAPRQGIYLGIEGYITRNLAVSDNTLINCNTSLSTGVSGAAIRARALTGSTVADNKIIGSTHTYGATSNSACSNNIFMDNTTNGHTIAAFLNESADLSTIYREPKSYYSTENADTIQEAVTLADDASATLRLRGGLCRCIALITSNAGGNYGVLVFNGGAAPTVISKSTDLIVGATNPDTDNALNIYPLSGNRIGIKNRLGATRTVQITTFGTKL